MEQQTKTPTSQAVNAPQGLAVASMVLGILGILTGFIGVGVILGIIAVILGIISLAKRRGGKGFAITGIITGGVAIISGILLLITFVTYQGIQSRANEASVKAGASELRSKVQTYQSDNGDYPTYDELITSYSEFTISHETLSNLHAGKAATVSASAPIAYNGCSQGAAIYYWDQSRSTVETYSFGDPAKCD